MGRTSTSLLGRLLIVGALFFTLAGPAAAAPCWKSVVLDWSADGSVDKTYPLACYHQAIAHLQPDLRLYSSAPDDIRRALQAVVTTNGQTTTEEPETTPGGTPTTETTPEPTTTSAPTTTTTPGKVTPKPPKTAVVVAPKDDDSSVPVPLLVLGAVAILLVLAGIAGMIWRRSQGDPPGVA